ncbi:hypothetical protein JTE90_025636 [Oedothorax gibbosus]|uniref:Uncharacterized protein n=1 Tax=Oedothorax gibbosus TaxID=931172 RepID=A0AAV6V8B2_9ARAC|nr:hypothetical protein JTE90_025636 [Oedothorax gibbosus]
MDITRRVEMENSYGILFRTQERKTESFRRVAKLGAGWEKKEDIRDVRYAGLPKRTSRKKCANTSTGLVKVSPIFRVFVNDHFYDLKKE